MVQPSRLWSRCNANPLQWLCPNIFLFAHLTSQYSHTAYETEAYGIRYNIYRMHNKCHKKIKK